MMMMVTDPKKAAGALQWAVFEMMKRYKMFSEKGVKDLAGYNAPVSYTHLPWRVCGRTGTDSPCPFSVLSKGRPLSVKPVSYTHLDVYKRQVLLRLRDHHILQRVDPPAGLFDSLGQQLHGLFHLRQLQHIGEYRLHLLQRCV